MLKEEPALSGPSYFTSTRYVIIPVLLGNEGWGGGEGARYGYGHKCQIIQTGFAWNSGLITRTAIAEVTGSMHQWYQKLVYVHTVKGNLR